MKIVIVGAGEVGFHIASRLTVENKEVVVIDKNAEALRRVSETIDAQVIEGSGSSPVVLEEAGVHEAEILLAVTNSDETNLVACLAASILSPATKKLARLRDADFDNYHSVFKDQAPHIDTVINPEIEVVKTIENLMAEPGAVDVGEFADGRLKMIGTRIDPGSPLDGVRLADLPAHTGGIRPLIAAVLREDELIIPSGADQLLANDIVYFISENEKCTQTLAVFGKQEAPLKRILIVGGGRLGYRLAQRLEELNINAKIVERRPERCSWLADQLRRVIVLCGDGSDQELLREENIEATDAMITLTNDEETNILASLLAKRMGVRKTITKISKFSYFSLMPTIGIDQVVSGRLSAINTILQHIRRGKVLSAMSIKGEQGEVMEAVALETSAIVGKPLQKLKFPKGALVAAIIRKDAVIIPTGASVIEPEDRCIIFAQQQAIPKIEKILAVKLEYF